MTRLQTFMRPEVQFLLSCARLNPTNQDRATIHQMLRALDFDWAYTLKVARQHGLLPFIYHHIYATNAIAPSAIPGSVATAIREYDEQLARRNLRFTSYLIGILRLLQEHHIPALAIKGPVLAQQAYGSMTMRQFSDLDILVRKNDFSRVEEILIKLGYRACERELSEPDRAANDNVTNARIYEAPALGIILEIHHTLARANDPYPISYDMVAPRTQTVMVCGTQIPTLHIIDLIVFLCSHGARHAWERIEWVTNLAELLKKEQNVDSAHLMRRARDLHVKRAVYTGMYLARDLLDAPLPSGFPSKDRRAQALADATRKRLISEPTRSPTLSEIVAFQIRSASEWTAIPQLFSTIILTPTSDDRRAVPLPKQLFPLYAIVRPARLAWKYASRPFSRLRSS